MRRSSHTKANSALFNPPRLPRRQPPPGHPGNPRSSWALSGKRAFVATAVGLRHSSPLETVGDTPKGASHSTAVFG